MAVHKMVQSANALLATFLVAATVTTVQADEIQFPAAELDYSQNLAKTLKAEAANRLYDKVYRNYIEICGGSRWQKRGVAPGGNFGHGFAMIRGACRVFDPATNIQQLTICPGKTVGISTDSNFNSTQWTAVQSREMMLYGGLSPSSPLERATYEKVLALAAQDGFLNGVKFRVDSTEVKNELNSELDYTAGTEFAVAVSRNVNCTRIPLVGTIQGRENGPLEEVIAYFNKLNQDAYRSATSPGATGKPPFGFDYDVQVNNCAHTPYNALAAIGFWGAKNTSGHPELSMLELPLRLGDAVVPFNALLEAFERSNHLDVGQLMDWLNQNPKAMKSLKENGWIGAQAGVVIEEIPPHNFKNTIYDPTVNLEFYSVSKLGVSYLCSLLPFHVPFLNCKSIEDKLSLTQQSFQKLIDAPEMNLRRNLELWRTRYETVLKDNRLQKQSEVASALRRHFEAKLKETVEILANIQRLETETDREPGPQFSL